MKDIFTRNDDYNKIAFMNWRTEKDDPILNIINLADGFLKSSNLLAKSCLEDNDDNKADIVIFPIMMNANHGIELYLKGMTWMLNILLGTNKKIEGSHNIKQIYFTVRAKIKDYDGDLSHKMFDEATIGLRSYIEELFDKIDGKNGKDNMDFSRYPFDTSYENHFYVEHFDNVEVDLENFVLRFEEIHKQLDDICEYLYHHELHPPNL